MLHSFSRATFRWWRRRPIVFAVALSLMTRCAWLVSAAVGTRWSQPGHELTETSNAGVCFAHLPQPILDIWTRWDSLFYVDLAHHGYAGATDAPRLAFFPLFPLLIRGAASFLHLSLPIAGLLVANGFDCIGWAMMAIWLQRRLPADQALWAMLAFAFFPSRNFGFSLYSEGLFLTLSMSAFLAFDTKRFGLASLCSALTSAVRPQGILVGLALGLAYCFQVRGKPLAGRKKVLLTAALLVLSSPVGMLTYAAHLWHVYGQPLLFLEVQRRRWKPDVTTPWAVFAHAGGWQDYLALGVAVPMVVKMLARKKRPEDLIYMLLSFGVPLTGGRLTSWCRLSGVLPPLFVELGEALSGRRKKMAYLSLAALASMAVAFRVGQGAKII